MSWFEEWFNSPYYHILYKNRDSKEAEFFIDNLMNRMCVPINAQILDIPCGKGRHSIYLNKKGYNVTGVDLSSESIKHANTFKGNKLDFFVHDMREIFANDQYDVVLNIFTSFGYFENIEEDQKCIDTFAHSLKKGGRLVIDFMNMHKINLDIQAEESKSVSDIEFVITKKIEANFLVKNIQFNDKGKLYSFQEKVNILYKEDFLKYFNFAGLKLKEVFGDYQLNEFRPELSDRLILIAEK